MGFIQMTQMVSLLAFTLTFPPDGLPWDHGRLEVSPDNRFIQHEDGTVFYWLGDTVWEFFHQATDSEVVQLLDNRQAKGFTVIQAVLLGELNGLNSPTPEGHRPLLNNNPATPDVKPGDDNDYWDQVDWMLSQAEQRGLYIGVLPTWGDKVDLQWGVGPVVFNTSNAYAYGEFLGNRYKDRPNVIWIIGGDRQGGSSFNEIWDAMANGIKSQDSNHLMTYHPWGGTSSSNWFHNDDWLDHNMLQSGHSAYHLDNYSPITSDYNKTPVKPTLDGEPRYEDHPVSWNPSNGYFRDADVREAAYWSIFAGGFGHTYGHHSIWQWHEPGDGGGISSPDRYWYDGLDRPGAYDMTHVKALMLSRPFFTRVPDQSLLNMDASSGVNRVQSTRGEDYLFVYTGTGRALTVYMGRIGGAEVKAWWYNPREGTATLIGTYANAGSRSFDPPGGEYFGNDWVLVVDNAGRSDFPEPGQAIWDGNYTPMLEGPTNLTAYAGSADEVELSWQDNSDNEDGFVVERKPYGGINEWYEVVDLAGNVTSYTDTDSLHGLVSYTYRVGAYKN